MSGSTTSKATSPRSITDRSSDCQGSNCYSQVEEMTLERPSDSSIRVQGVVACLDELEQFYGGEAQLQTAHYFGLIRGHLDHLMRLSDVTPTVLHALTAISNFAYGWGPLRRLGPTLQSQVPNPFLSTLPSLHCQHAT